ncbi:hypothetical protein LAYK3_06950 [Lactobacillus amylovorus subsp. amylovorus]|nr:hypothetical protein LAYK3_06950 [Lactobacillus amylovorus]GMM21618.1 hypothetical protein LAYK10_09250 [Lactobacillus amylovorus]
MGFAIIMKKNLRILYFVIVFTIFEVLYTTYVSPHLSNFWINALVSVLCGGALAIILYKVFESKK